MKKLIVFTSKAGMAFLLAAALSGCATTSHQTFLPDGSPGYKIDCSGEGGNMGACMQKAGEVCGADGYKIVDKSGTPSTGNVQNQNNVNVSVPQGGILGVASYISNSGNQHYMLIKCKNGE